MKNRRFSVASSLVAATVLLGACAKESKPAAGAAPDLAPGAPVARFEGGQITAGELDARVAGEIAKLEQQKYEARRDALEQMVTQRLVQAEAKKKGVTEEEWLKAEIDAKIPPPSEEEIVRVFEGSKEQMGPEAKLEDFRERIVAFLTRTQRQQRAQEVFRGLREGAGVKLLLPEPERERVQVDAKGPSQGPDDAKVTIVEFSDFECPYCSRAKETVDEVMKAYQGKVRLVFRHYPLSFHPNAAKAAEASACAADQGKFWPYHDQLFANQSALGVGDLKNHAATVGLDPAAFATCLDSGKHGPTVKGDMAAGEAAGVDGTPAFFINGIRLAGAQPIDEFRKVIDGELAR